MYWILHYLKGTSRKGLLFEKGMELSLEAYTNANYARSIMDRNNGLLYIFGGNLGLLVIVF